MTPRVLRLHNFRSFVGTHEFEFEGKPGLYFLTAENLEDEELGGNGGGKTTLWEALTWVLYGKTSRGLRAGDLLSWWTPDRGYWCELDLTREGKVYRLHRAWNPNRVTLGEWTGLPESLADASQEDVDNLIGMGFDSFLHAVFISQFQPMFLDLSPADKASLLSKVLNLDRWLEYSQRAADRAKFTEVDRVKMFGELQRVAGAIEAQSAEDWTSRINSWLAERQTYRAAQQKRLLSIENEIESMLCERSAIEEMLLVKQAELAEAIAMRNDAQIGERDCSQRASTLRAEIAALRARREMPSEQLAFLRKNDFCPFCSQTISERHSREECERLQGVLANSETEERAVRKSLDHILGVAGQHADALALAKSLLDDLSASMSALREEVSSLAARIESAEKEKTIVLRSLTESDQLSNPYAEEQRRQMLSLVRLKSRRMLLTERITQLQHTVEVCDFWTKQFKIVRLFLISEALARFELEANNCLQQLGLPGWRVSFEVDSETKSGTIRRGFTVLIETPKVDKPVPWEVWSGGESQRLRIAVQMGLSNLIADALGVDIGIEVWDEPSRWLSESGIDNLLDSLKHRAEVQRREIWIVDHRSLLFGGFSRSVKIAKDSCGSRIDCVAKVVSVGDDRRDSAAPPTFEGGNRVQRRVLNV